MGAPDATPSQPTVPVIDLGDRRGAPTETVVDAVASAAETFGFFHVVGHGVSGGAIESLRDMTERFFAGSRAEKRRIMRTEDGSRGYYDRELTKNARDLKEVLDIGQVPFPDLAADDPRNERPVDGPNRWPDIDGFRSTVLTYLDECSALAQWLLQAFCRGLGSHADHLDRHFGPDHTSFLRMNHYPLGDLLDADEASVVTALGDMALHHHTDAGAFTILLQDDVGGLQVRHDDDWLDVTPMRGGLVVNTGDMMQVWSNDRYRAALHRVLPRAERERFSWPYFFNPSYDTDYAPLPGSIAPGDRAHYRPINWGAFRRARAGGDYADVGTEIQISQFELGDGAITDHVTPARSSGATGT